MIKQYNPYLRIYVRLQLLCFLMSAFSCLDSLLVWQEITRILKLSIEKKVTTYSRCSIGKFQVIALKLSDFKILHTDWHFISMYKKSLPAQILILEMFAEAQLCHFWEMLRRTQLLHWSELQPSPREDTVKDET